MDTNKNEKKIGFVRLGLAFAGCFLGAGYVSGQEMWQFFGSFGLPGFFGLALALGLLLTMGYIAIMMNRITGTTIDRFALIGDIPVLKYFMLALISIQLFSVSIVMTAGSGALVESLTGIPHWIVSAVFIFTVATISLAGLDGVVSAFSMTVPLLTGFTIIFAVASCVRNGIHINTPEGSADNPLLSSWFISAMSFSCYNTFINAAVFSPLGVKVKDKKNIALGTVFGILILLVISCGELTSMSTTPEVTQAELPMLALALDINRFWGSIYGILIFLAMLGTALSTLVAFTQTMFLRSKKIGKHRRSFVYLCAAVAFAASLTGFGSLISILYPIFGYCSSIFIIMMVINYIKAKKQMKKGTK